MTTIAANAAKSRSSTSGSSNEVSETAVSRMRVPHNSASAVFVGVTPAKSAAASVDIGDCKAAANVDTSVDVPTPGLPSTTTSISSVSEARNHPLDRLEAAVQRLNGLQSQCATKCVARRAE